MFRRRPYKRYRRRFPVRRPGMRPNITYQRRNRRTGGFIGMENKFNDSFASNRLIVAPTGAAGGELDPVTQQCLNGITQGIGESERIGRRIRMKNIAINGIVFVSGDTLQTTFPVAPNVVIYLVLDKQTNGVQLKSEDVFVNPSANSSLATNVHFNLENKDRFLILKKKTIIFNQINSFNDAAGTGTVGRIEKPFTIFKDLKNIRVNYTGVGNTVSSIADKSLHVITYCSNVDMAPGISYNCRLRYYD